MTGAAASASGYPYGGRNLFAEPETYEYATAGPALIGTWRAERRAAIDRFARSQVAAQRKPAAERDPASLDLILDALAAGREPDGFHVKGGVLGGFVTKFEIFRRLFRSYDDQLRKTLGAAPATPDDYVRFAQVLVALPENDDRARILSTLLKLNDALTSLSPAEFSPAARDALVQVLRREKELVQSWQARVETRVA